MSNYDPADYKHYSLKDEEIGELAQDHSKLADESKDAHDRYDRSKNKESGGYVLATVGPTLVIILFMLHYLWDLDAGWDLKSQLGGLKHYRKIFNRNSKGLLTNNARHGRKGIDALFKIIFYAGLIVACITVGTRLMIIPENKKKKQYKDELNRISGKRDEAQRDLDEAQRRFDSSSA